MTEAPTIEPEAVPVQPRANSRLAQLHEQYADAKAEERAAADKLKAITDAIKLELTTAAPEAPKVDLVPAKGSAAPPLRLVYTETWRLDSRALKKQLPETYVKFAVKGGSWTLKQLAAGGEGE